MQQRTTYKMAIFSVYIINRAGGLIYQYDHSMPKSEVEKTFSYPLELVLKIYDDKVVVAYGQRDGIKGRWRLTFPTSLSQSLHEKTWHCHH